jgi:hypothetical protein
MEALQERPACHVIISHRDSGSTKIPIKKIPLVSKQAVTLFLMAGG